MNKALSGFSGNLSLRSILILPFVTLLFLATGLTAYWSFHNGQKAVNELVGRLLGEASTRIEQHVRNYLGTPHLFHKINNAAIRNGNLKVKKFSTLQRHFQRQVQLSDSVNYLYYGDENDNFMGVQRQANGQTVVKFRNSKTAPKRKIYLLDDKGKRKKLIQSKKYYPRTRPWYKAAIQANGPAWSPIYPSAHKKVLQITPVAPVYRMPARGKKKISIRKKTEKIQGVLGINLILSEISRFLHKLNISQSGQAFIIERSGHIVANSTLELPFITSEGKQKRLLATESGSLLIQSTAGHLLERFQSFKGIDANQQLSFELEGERHLVQTTPFSDEYGLDWLIVVVIPEADFMGQIHANTRTTLILTLITLVLVILVGVITAHWLVQPILGLNTAAKKLAGGQWEQELPQGHSSEIKELAGSFKTMAAQLKESFQTLEKRVEERTKDLSVAYRKLKASQAQLVQSEKMASLGQMVAGVAHEINTPLGYVKSNVEMTRELFGETENLVTEYDKLIKLLTSKEANEEELNALLARVAELNEGLREDDTFQETRALLKDTTYGIDQISELVLNLKDFSRLDQAKTADVNLNECLDSVLMIAHNVLKHKITVNKQYGKIPKLRCSPSQINQVFLNLLTNASQAIEETGTILIKTSADDKGVDVVIQDNGKGIPKQALPKIFDPFFTTKPIGQGTGLGLSISYKIIQEHGGTIRVASQTGKGTKFLVRLPVS
ncbi:MAG: HAMP domain-containing protein [Gammaproteobacteria bacterium]|nr:HAMP domain-containing protein [Gammaproteobacteria bacterium]